MPTIYPYTVTNSQKGGFFMRTYNRNVRRAWDGDHYHAPKRQKLDTTRPRVQSLPVVNENTRLEVEDNLQRAIRETSVAMSSSPSRKNSTVSSLDYDAPEPVTPPSSPPQILQITPPMIKQRKPIFSGLEKKKQKEKEKEKSSAKRKRDDSDVGGRDDTEPLTEITNSSVRPNGPTTSTPAANSMQLSTEGPAQRLTTVPPSLPRTLTQTVLDFGQANTPITCPQCQMSYTPSVAEDIKLHTMYHDRNKNGIELDKAFTKSAMKWCYETPGIEGSVVVVDRKISLPARRTVQKILEVVNKELGSVEIPETDLWGQKALDGDNEDAKKVDCYKVFLHMLNGKCVAVCLAERIAQGYKVKATNIPSTSSEGPATEVDATLGKEDPALLTPTSSAAPQPHFPSSADIQLEETPSKVVVGVSRIWTSKSYRKRGIANNLLECVGNQFIYGMMIEKEEVAFSQPTDSGAALARAWFGSDSGWCVYKET